MVEPALPPAPMKPEATQRASRNVRDDTVGGTFRRLHADGEQDHHRNGGAQTVFRQGHEDAHDTLDGLPEPQAPQSSSHAEFARSPVRRDTTDGSREYVHQTIARCQDTGDGQINVELIVQVQRRCCSWSTRRQSRSRTSRPCTTFCSSSCQSR